MKKIIITGVIDYIEINNVENYGIFGDILALLVGGEEMEFLAKNIEKIETEKADPNLKTGVTAFKIRGNKK